MAITEFNLPNIHDISYTEAHAIHAAMIGTNGGCWTEAQAQAFRLYARKTLSFGLKLEDEVLDNLAGYAIQWARYAKII